MFVLIGYHISLVGPWHFTTLVGHLTFKFTDKKIKNIIEKLILCTSTILFFAVIVIIDCNQLNYYNFFLYIHKVFTEYLSIGTSYELPRYFEAHLFDLRILLVSKQ